MIALLLAVLLSSTPSRASEAASAWPFAEDLPSPTESLEAYEAAKKKRIIKSTIPDWAVSAGTVLDPFSNVDWRIPVSARTGGAGDTNPSLSAFVLTGERFLLRDKGLLSIGLDVGAYLSNAKNPFDKMRPALWSAAPSLHYEFNYFDRQILVPSVRFDYQFLRYGYRYHAIVNRGIKRIPRFDIGAMLYLNFFEPLQAGIMQSEIGVKRTYLAAYYSLAKDSTRTVFDATEKAWKVALRFEF